MQIRINIDGLNSLIVFFLLLKDVLHVLIALREALTTCGPQIINLKELSENAAGFF